MVTVVGGSGVFSGPTGAQYQQAGVEGLSNSLATQRAFQEQKRQALDLEIWRMAEDYGEKLGIPAVAAFQDPGFKGMAQQKLGSSMGGFLGLGGSRRTEAYLNELSRIYSGQEADRLAAEGNLARDRLRLQTREQVDESFDQAGYNAAYANLVAPPPPPAAVTPPPAPGTQPPASTPAPASTPLQKNPPGFWQGTVPAADTLQPTSPVTQAATTKAPAGSGTGVPDPEKVREWYRNTGLSLAAAFGNKDAAREKRIKDLTTAISQTEEELSVLRAAGDSAKLDMKLRFHQNNIAELDRLTNGEFSKQKSGGGPVPAQVTPGLAASKPAPEAAGQSAGVGAAAPVDPQQLDTATLQNFWTKMYQEGKVTNPMAQVDTMRKLVVDNPGSFQRLMGGSVQGTTPASAAAAAPVGLELPTKLGWSSDDLALFRRFQSVSPDEIGSDPQTRQEYARFRQMNQQLKDEFTKETRKEIRGYAAAPGYEKDQLVQQSLQFLETTDPSNPILKDPRFANLSTNLTQQNIRMAEAKIRNELAQAGYTEAKIKTVVDDTEAALLMGQAEVLKARNEGLKAAYEGIDTVISDLTAEFSKAMFAAKGNKAQEDAALAAYNKALSENPVLQSMWDSSLKLMAQSNGLQVTMENYMIQRAKFLQAGKTTQIPTASAFGTGTEEPQYSAEEQAVLNSY